MTKALLNILAPISSDLSLVQETLENFVQTTGLTDSVTYPITYPLDNQGKQLRAALVLLAAQLGKRNNRETVIQVGAAAELIHLATLLHDDVLDHAAERRGAPTLGAIWGNRTSILTGDYFFARAYTLLVKPGQPALLDLFTDAIAKVCAGEMEEHLDSFNLHISRERYLERIGNKSASLFSACAQGGGLLAGLDGNCTGALARYGYNLGIAFQLIDDLLDICGDRHRLGKPVGQDLQQGVYTLPVLVALTDREIGEKIVPYLGGTLTGPQLDEVRGLIATSNGCEATTELALFYRHQAYTELDLLPPGPARDSLASLADFVVAQI